MVASFPFIIPYSSSSFLATLRETRLPATVVLPRALPPARRRPALALGVLSECLVFHEGASRATTVPRQINCGVVRTGWFRDRRLHLCRPLNMQAGLLRKRSSGSDRACSATMPRRTGFAGGSTSGTRRSFARTWPSERCSWAIRSPNCGNWMPICAERRRDSQPRHRRRHHAAHGQTVRGGRDPVQAAERGDPGRHERRRPDARCRQARGRDHRRGDGEHGGDDGRRRKAGINVFVCSILPTNPDTKNHAGKAPILPKINEKLKAACAARGCIYVDYAARCRIAAGELPQRPGPRRPAPALRRLRDHGWPPERGRTAGTCGCNGPDHLSQPSSAARASISSIMLRMSSTGSPRRLFLFSRIGRADSHLGIASAACRSPSA